MKNNIELIINWTLKVVVMAVLITITASLCSFLDAKETDLRTNTVYTEQVIKSYK